MDGKFFARGANRFDVHGVTYGTFRPRSDGARFPERNQVKSDFSAMRESGFNVARTYTEPPQDLLDLASDWDVHLLAGVFWPDWRYLVGASRRQCREVARTAATAVRAATRRLAGHDRVFALCVGNEVPADVIRWVGTVAVASVIAELADIVRQEDPERLVTYANYPSAEYLPLDDLDFLTFNIFLERKADLRRYLTRLHHLAGDRPLVIGEMGLDAGGDTEAAEQRQAATLDWQLETAIERGVAGTCLFSWTDEWWVGDQPVEGWHFGLTRADRSPRPALAVAERWNGRTVADLLATDLWPSITVVICAYNAAETIDECLRHTCELDYPDLQIVVVDDGSTDETASIIGAHQRAQLVTIEHAGLSVARNAGLRAASGELVAYLDADAYPSAGWPYYLSLGLDSRFVVGVGGPNVPPPTDDLAAEQVARAPGGPVHVLLSDDRAEHLPGCNMAFWRAELEEVGGFTPVYTSAGDDVDLCWRVLDRGGEIAFHPAALVWHHRRAGARAYVRQQRGYGRAEALLATRHPDRFNELGSVRWRGRIYNSLVPLRGRQRVYRGTYGAAAYQSVYGGGGTAMDVAHQLGVPFAVIILATAPMALLAPVLGLPAMLAFAMLLILGRVDLTRATAPRRLQRGRLRFRLGVVSLCLAQPLVRAWGRAGAANSALRGLPPAPPLNGPVKQCRGGILILPATGERETTTAAVVDVVRRAKVGVTPSTGWEGHDVGLRGSLLVAARLMTSGHLEGTVQVAVRRYLRLRMVLLAVVLVGSTVLLDPVFGSCVLLLVLAEVARGAWRTGPLVRRAIVRAAGEAP